mgnify:CR=1 FL=1
MELRESFTIRATMWLRVERARRMRFIAFAATARHQNGR